MAVVVFICYSWISDRTAPKTHNENMVVFGDKQQKLRAISTAVASAGTEVQQITTSRKGIVLKPQEKTSNGWV